MYGKQAVFLFIALEITCLQTSDIVNILASEKNFFHNINSQLHKLTNKLFNSFNLSLEFTKCIRIKRLLSMHNNLVNIAKKHSSIYDYIQKISYAKEKVITDLDKMFENIINEEIKHITNEKNQNSTNECNNTFDSVIEGYVNDVLDKLTFLPIKDIVNGTRDIKVNINDNSPLKSREIKVWRPSSAEDEDTLNKTRRIYEGKKTHIKKYPFIASVHVMKQFMCAASIISKNLVITAATCLQIVYNNHYMNPYSIFVRVGSDYTNRHGEMIPVLNVLFHPDYDPTTLKNNLAILRMAKRMKFSKKRKIQRIKYDSKEGVLHSNSNVSIMGWGVKKAHHDYSYSETHKLSLARLSIYDIEDCKEIYSPLYVTETTFCAGFESKGGGACNRDVGGPCIVSGVLVGVISFGPVVCGMTDAPTVFTKLSYYTDWIDDIIMNKPLMRNNKEKKTFFKKNPRESGLTTSDRFQSEKENSDFQTVTTKRTYPDEISILKEILQEIALSNNTVIDYIIYGGETDENDSKDIKATKKQDVYSSSTANKMVQLGRQSQHLAENKQINKKIADIDAGSSSSEESDVAVKILESLVGYTSVHENTAKLFHVSGSKGEKYKTTRNFRETETPHLYNERNNESIDTSNYYEEYELSIEMAKSSMERNPTTKHPTNKHKYFDKLTSKKGKKNVDHNNVIFNRNKFREGRNLSKGSENQKKPKAVLENTGKNRVKNIRSKENKYLIRQSDDSDDVVSNDTFEEPLGITMAISDQDFDYEDDNIVTQKYNNNMRSKDDNTSVLWRFRRIS